MAFSPVLRSNMGRERPDMPQTKVKDVGHFMDGLRSAALGMMIFA